MMGVAVALDFAEHRRVYVYSTSNMVTPHTNRLMRFEVSGDFTGASERRDIVDNVPHKMEATDHPFGGPGAHNGGRVRFNPAGGYLYVTRGDTHNSAMPPIWNNNGWSQGTSSAAFLTGKAWGDWEGAMIVGLMGISPAGPGRSAVHVPRACPCFCAQAILRSRRNHVCAQVCSCH